MADASVSGLTNIPGMAPRCRAVGLDGQVCLHLAGHDNPDRVLVAVTNLECSADFARKSPVVHA